MEHPARLSALLAVVSVTMILASCGSLAVVVPEGLVVSPNEAATMYVSGRCGLVTVDGRATNPRPGILGMDYNVLLPAGRRAIAMWSTRDPECYEYPSDTTLLSFDAVAGHRYIGSLVPRVYREASGRIVGRKQWCLQDVVSRDKLPDSVSTKGQPWPDIFIGDTICAFPPPKASAQRAVLIFGGRWQDFSRYADADAGLTVDMIDRDSAFIRVQNVAGARLGLSPGPHTVVVRYDVYAEQKSYRWGMERIEQRTHTTGDPCQLEFVAEAGHSYVLHARLDKGKWAPWLEDRQPEAGARETTVRCVSPAKR